MTDDYWIEQLKKGSREALRKIIEEHQDYVYSVAFKIVRNRELAEEITQDVFVKVYRNIRSFRYESLFSTWLYTIVYRTGLNYLQRRRIVLPESDLLPESEDISVELKRFESAETGDSDADHFGLQEIIWKAVDRLPVMQGVTILLYYMNQFSISEIARILQAPENTVKTHLHRGRSSLKNILLKHYSPEELL